MGSDWGNKCLSVSGAALALVALRLWRRVPLVRAALLVSALAVYLSGCGSRPDNGDLLYGRRASPATLTNRAERATDGVAAVAGDSWNSDLCSVIEIGGSLEWDLGSPQRIGAAWLQADNNDEYAVLVSSDATTWKTVWLAPMISDAGQQVRKVQNLSAVARYVRLEPRGGDGAYSIAEFGLFSPSAAFPPQFVQRTGGTEAQAALAEHNRAFSITAVLAGLAFLVLGNFRRSARPRTVVGVLTDPLLWLVILASALVTVTARSYAARYNYNTIDDAYISFQYAKNWASGQGVVFNPGERVEGYTNFLWVAVLAPLWPLVGRDAVSFAHAASWLALALGLCNLALIALIARRLFTTGWAPALAVLWVAFDDAFTSYIVFALENQLLITCMLLGLSAVVYRFRRWQLVLGLSFALVTMTRPDGILWAASFFASYAISLFAAKTEERKAQARSLGIVALAFVLSYGSYFAWRFSYYGYLLPNTFYLKVGGTFQGVERGYAYLKTFVRERWDAPLAALIAILLVREAWVRWLLVHAVLHMAYVVYVGGDFYSGHRFLLGLVPTLGLLVAAVSDQALIRAQKPLARLAVGLAGILLCLGIRWGTLLQGPGVAEIGVWGGVVDNHVRYMRWMKDQIRPNASMALGDIGGAGFFANLRVLDVYGVIDPTIAHRPVPTLGKGKPGHEKVATVSEILARKPTYIKLGFLPIFNPPRGYFLFNSFPPSVAIDGLFVKDDRALGHAVPGTAIHMSSSELSAWRREGSASSWIAGGRAPGNQGGIRGAVGTLINTFTAEEGDHATGRLLSPPFELAGDSLRLLVGGGRDPLRLRVSLIVDGAPVFTETGTNFETLGRREWNIAPLRGKIASLEVVDEVTGSWGHLLVDEVEQRVGDPAGSGKI